MRAADARPWARSAFTQANTSSGPSRNSASPTAETSWPRLMSPWTASRPPTSATTAMKHPVRASTMPFCRASARAARRVATSEPRLVRR
jgi:hypothetical protein